MKRIIVICALLLILPFFCLQADASTRQDTTNATTARFAAGLALENGAPVGTLALFTRLSPNFYNASSLLSSGKQGGISSQLFWVIYRTRAFSIALGTGASLDVVNENPTYDQAVTYLSAASGIALTTSPGKNIMIHLAYVNLNPGEIDRNYRLLAFLSLPLSL